MPRLVGASVPDGSQGRSQRNPAPYQHAGYNEQPPAGSAGHPGREPALHGAARAQGPGRVFRVACGRAEPGSDRGRRDRGARPGTRHQRRLHPGYQTRAGGPGPGRSAQRGRDPRPALRCPPQAPSCDRARHVQAHPHIPAADAGGIIAAPAAGGGLRARSGPSAGAVGEPGGRFGSPGRSGDLAPPAWNYVPQSTHPVEPLSRGLSPDRIPPTVHNRANAFRVRGINLGAGPS